MIKYSLEYMKSKKWSRLTVIDGPVFHKSKRHWKCVCDCGNETLVLTSRIVSSHTQSCGCVRNGKIASERIKEEVVKNPVGNKKDLTSKVFSRWTVIEEAGRNKRGQCLWLCRCECGKAKIIWGRHLIIGDSKSCGCLLKETSRELIKKLHVAQKGTGNHRWNPSLTNEERNKKRIFPAYSEWRRKVQENSCFTCDICQKKGGEIAIHHLDGYASNPALRLSLENGICLCKEHHEEFHAIYGKTKGNNTKEEYFEFRIQKRKETILEYPTVISYKSVPHPELHHIRVATYGKTQFCTGYHYPDDNAILGVFIPSGYIVSDELLVDMELKDKLSGPQKNRVKKTKFKGIESMGIFYGSECEGEKYKRFNPEWREGQIVPESWGVYRWIRPESIERVKDEQREEETKNLPKQEQESFPSPLHSMANV